MSQVSKRKKSAKKMRRRKLQKKCNSEDATLEVAFFRILRCICFGAVAFLFAFFSFFFVKKIQKLIKVAKKKQRRKCNVASCKKNATEKMQRWKLHFFCIFRSGWTVYVCIVFLFLSPFAFHYTPPPNPSSRPCPSPQLHLTLSAFHACSLLFTPLSPSTLSSEQEWRCWVEAEMNM